MMSDRVSLKEKLVSYNIKVNIINGVFAAIAFNLVNPYLAKFAERLGATDYQIAYLTSFPYFVSIFAYIPGAILIESLSNKKKTTGTIMFIHKLFYLLLAILPFLKGVNQASLFITIIGFMNLPGAMATMGYQSSIGDVFSIEDRGNAMGLRNKYSTIFALAVTFISGQLLTYIPKTNEDSISLYQIFFFFAFIFSLGEVISFFKFRGMKRKKESSRYIDSLKTTLKNLPKEKNYLIFTLISAFFYIGWMGAQPLFNIYTIKVLGANEFWLSSITISSSLSSILSFTKWAKFADKKGNNFALGIALMGMAITPIFYVLSKNIIMLVLFNIIIGIAVAGTNLILFNMLLEVTPSINRTIYIAIYNTLTAIVSAIAPIMGVAIKDMTSIAIALIIIAILRFIASFMFIARGLVRENN
jgi:MFS family permease